MRRRPQRSTLFPYPTLFRSRIRRRGAASHRVLVVGDGPARDVLCRQLDASPHSGLRVVGACPPLTLGADGTPTVDRKSTRLNSSHANISYAVFCLKKKKIRE